MSTTFYPIIRNYKRVNDVEHQTADGQLPYLIADLKDGTTVRGEMGGSLPGWQEIGDLVVNMRHVETLTQTNAR